MRRNILGDVLISWMPPGEKKFLERRRILTATKTDAAKSAFGYSQVRNYTFGALPAEEPKILLALFYAPRLMSSPYLLWVLRPEGEDRYIYLFDCRAANGPITVVGIGDDRKETVRRMFLRLVSEEGFRMPNRVHASAELGLGKEDLLTGWDGIGYYKDFSGPTGFLRDFTQCSFYPGLPEIPKELKFLSFIG